MFAALTYITLKLENNKIKNLLILVCHELVYHVVTRVIVKNK